MSNARTKLLAGNWKMNLTLAQAKALASELARLSPPSGSEVAVCPPFVHLESVAQILRPSAVAWGSQDVYFEPNGAFTGEISVAMLVDLGCRFGIVGHSERRLILGETDEAVRKKAAALLAGGMTPIVCVGETLEQREQGITAKITRGQMAGSLAGFDQAQMARIVIAYEPVWAIGTGRTATPQQAQEVHADLRNWLAERYNGPLAAQVRILYGGSVKPDNARDLLTQPDIDGALVGGASLDGPGFSRIVQAASAQLIPVNA